MVPPIALVPPVLISNEYERAIEPDPPISQVERVRSVPGCNKEMGINR